MASPELHIKDCFYFEVPKLLWQSARKTKAEFPSVWVKNDAQFQDWEADRLLRRLTDLDAKSSFGLPSAESLKADYHAWKEHGHDNFGKPLRLFFEEQRQALQTKFAAWKRDAGEAAHRVSFGDWLKQSEQAELPGVWFARQMEDGAWSSQWSKDCRWAGDIQEFVKSTDAATLWSPSKIEAYNYHLNGKILIPQPFGDLRNLYQAESGFCLSKFMVIEALVGLTLLVAFTWLSRRLATGQSPRGRLWNFLEAILVMIRDEVARKAIHSHHGHDEDGHGDESHADGHSHGSTAHADHEHAHAAHAHDDGHGHGAHAHAHAHDNPHAEADRFVPFLWTLFLFILGCNLAGMLPWLGSPTGSWGVTVALALLTFSAGFVCGAQRFGFFGYWANQVPSMGLPTYIAVVLVPMIFLIEVLGLAIKHTVLSVRLLANMVAGHLVLLAVMALAFSVQGAMSSSWGITAFFALFGATALSCLELFVALLQAYVFTFLSALFINAAINQH